MPRQVGTDAERGGRKRSRIRETFRVPGKRKADRLGQLGGKRSRIQVSDGGGWVVSHPAWRVRRHVTHFHIPVKPVAGK